MLLIFILILIIVIFAANQKMRIFGGGLAADCLAEHYKKIVKRKKIVGKKLLAVWHYADWCGYCQAAKPEWKAAANELGRNSAIEIYEEDYDAANTVGIETVPTLYFYDIAGDRAIKYEGKMNSREIILAANNIIDEI